MEVELYVSAPTRTIADSASQSKIIIAATLTQEVVANLLDYSAVMRTGSLNQQTALDPLTLSPPLPTSSSAYLISNAEETKAASRVSR